MESTPHLHAALPSTRPAPGADHRRHTTRLARESNRASTRSISKANGSRADRGLRRGATQRKHVPPPARSNARARCRRDRFASACRRLRSTGFRSRNPLKARSRSERARSRSGLPGSGHLGRSSVDATARTSSTRSTGRSPLSALRSTEPAMSRSGSRRSLPSQRLTSAPEDPDLPGPPASLPQGAGPPAQC